MALFLFTIFVDRIKKICYYLEKYLIESTKPPAMLGRMV